MSEDYVEKIRKRNPLEYEKARVLIDITSDIYLEIEDNNSSIEEFAAKMGISVSKLKRLLDDEDISVEKLVELAFHLGKQIEMRLVDIDNRDFEKEVDKLSPRQKQVSCLITKGFSLKQIAINLGISYKTVEAHRAEIGKKLKISKNTEIASIIARSKLMQT